MEDLKGSGPSRDEKDDSKKSGKFLNHTPILDELEIIPSERSLGIDISEINDQKSLVNLYIQKAVENIEKYIPQVLNADKLNTVSYKKGCYTGQEVIARTHYLGNVKKHVYLVNINNSEIHEKNIFYLPIMLMRYCNSIMASLMF